MVEKIFWFDDDVNEFKQNGFGVKVLEKIRRSFGLKKNEVKKEVSRRAKFIEGLRGKTAGEFFDEIKNYGRRN